MRRIDVVGVELGVAGESQYETELKPLRQGLFSDVRTDNVGILAGHRFREITQVARELIKRSPGHSGPQPHQHDMHDHRLRPPLRALLPAP
jgi:hypothetical protein